MTFRLIIISLLTMLPKLYYGQTCDSSIADYTIKGTILSKISGKTIGQQEFKVIIRKLTTNGNIIADSLNLRTNDKGEFCFSDSINIFICWTGIKVKHRQELLE